VAHDQPTGSSILAKLDGLRSRLSRSHLGAVAVHIAIMWGRGEEEWARHDGGGEMSEIRIGRGRDRRANDLKIYVGGFLYLVLLYRRDERWR
jgi:hypothetical protein